LKGFDQAATAAIEGYSWPGNVRELESRVKRAAIMADGTYIQPADLELDNSAPGSVLPLNLRSAREKTERKVVERALALFENNVSTAANALGIARPTLYKLINKYELNLEL
jgi:two-component system NtrC family response regulator